MSILSPESILGLLPVLLSGAAIIILCAFLLGRLIVFSPDLLFRLVTVIFDIGFNTVFFLIAKILRLFAIAYLLNWIFEQINHYFQDKKQSISYGQYIIILLCILGVIFSPEEFSVEEMAIIAVLSSLWVYKIFVAIWQPKFSYNDTNQSKTAAQSKVTTSSSRKQTKPISKAALSFVERAKQFEQTAFKAYQEGRLYDALVQYNNALDIYKSPYLATEQKLDANRAKLLEKIGVVLYKNEQFNLALMRFHQALDFYKKPHLAKDSHLRKDHVRVLKASAIILRKLGRIQEALKRDELISKLSNQSTMSKNFAW